MDYNKFAKKDSFQQWFEYEPHDVQYLKYAKEDPSIIAAGYKISDVYSAFADAHATFLFAGSDDFGQIAGRDDISMLYAKSHFLRYALLEYAICLDLSWQVIWAYVQPASLEYLMNQKYKEMEKECTRESLRAQLECSISLHGVGLTKAKELKTLFENFDSDADVKELRRVYNIVKHQGTIHIEGLGLNEEHMMIVIGNNAPPMLHRESFSVEKLERLLLTYNDKFIEYMNSILSVIMPEDYLDNKINLDDAFNAVNGIQGWNMGKDRLKDK